MILVNVWLEFEWERQVNGTRRKWPEIAGMKIFYGKTSHTLEGSLL